MLAASKKASCISVYELFAICIPPLHPQAAQFTAALFPRFVLWCVNMFGFPIFLEWRTLFVHLNVFKCTKDQMVGDRMRAKTPNGTLKEPKGVAQCTDAVRNWISAGTCASDWHFSHFHFILMILWSPMLQGISVISESYQTQWNQLQIGVQRVEVPGEQDDATRCDLDMPRNTWTRLPRAGRTGHCGGGRAVSRFRNWRLRASSETVIVHELFGANCKRIYVKKVYSTNVVGIKIEKSEIRTTPRVGKKSRTALIVSE